MVDNKSLYYQVRRMRNRRNEVVEDLKRVKMEKDSLCLSHKKDIVCLKNIILIQSAGIAVFAILYISKFFDY